MDSWWPWLAMAGAGALHGVNPAAGWALAAGCGLHARDRAQGWRALVPIGVGHLASMGLIATTVAFGGAIDRSAMLVLAGVLILAVIACHARRRNAPGARRAVPPVLLAFASFLMSTAHGAGLMLVPALMPLCAPGAAGGRGTDLAATALWTSLAAVGVHTAAMLLAAGFAVELAGSAVRLAVFVQRAVTSTSDRRGERSASVPHSSSSQLEADASKPCALLSSTSERPSSGLRSSSEAKPA